LNSGPPDEKQAAKHSGAAFGNTQLQEFFIISSIILGIIYILIIFLYI